MLLYWRRFISDQEGEFGGRERPDRSRSERSEDLLLINNLLITGCFRAQLPWPCQRCWLSVEAAGDTRKVLEQQRCPLSLVPTAAVLHCSS